MSDDLRRALEGSSGAIDHMRRDAEIIRTAYESLPRDWLRATLLVEYRCPNKRGCLLLHAWEGASGRILFYVPAYKLSATRNQERTAASARQRNTLDGDRNWKPRSGDLTDLHEWGPTVGLDLQCDHLEPVVVTAAEILDDAATATRGRPRKRVVTARLA